MLMPLVLSYNFFLKCKEVKHLNKILSKTLLMLVEKPKMYTRHQQLQNVKGVVMIVLWV